MGGGVREGRREWPWASRIAVGSARLPMTTNVESSSRPLPGPRIDPAAMSSPASMRPAAAGARPAAAQPTSDGGPDPPQEAQPSQFCATERLEAPTEIRNRRDQEIAQD